MRSEFLRYAGMAELADAHGSGPCESNFMQVQLLLPAPERLVRKSERAVQLYSPAASEIYL